MYASGALRYSMGEQRVSETGSTTNQSSQQLLAIWRRAKGKERDALLWGDEVW